MGVKKLLRLFFQCALVLASFLLTYPPVAHAEITKYYAPLLEVPIPGLDFTKHPIIRTPEGALLIPFLGAYISAAANYLISISVIAAAVMIVYGGFKYILGATLSEISSGKETISNAIVGLMLVFMTYTLLSTLGGTSLVALKPLGVQSIEPVMQEVEVVPTVTYWNAIKSSGDIKGLPANVGQPKPGSPPGGPLVGSGAKIQDGPCELTLNQAALPTVQSIYACGVTVAKEVGIPPCYIMVAINHESYLAIPNMIGHDEDVTAKVGKGGDYIVARKKLLADGVSFKGQPISGNQLNDDRPIDMTKDDLGLDPRFTHGGGLVGMTIKCILGECFPLKDRLMPYKGIKGGALVLKAALMQSKGLSNPTDPAIIRAAWDAYHGVDPKGRTEETIACLGMSDPLKDITPLQYTICRGDLPLDREACAAYVNTNLNGIVQPKTACQVGCFDKRMPIACNSSGCSIRTQ